MLLDLFDQLMQRIKANDKVHVSFCVSGIIGCLVVYGILQVSWLVGCATRFMCAFYLYSAEFGLEASLK